MRLVHNNVQLDWNAQITRIVGPSLRKLFRLSFIVGVRLSPGSNLSFFHYDYRSVVAEIFDLVADLLHDQRNQAGTFVNLQIFAQNFGECGRTDQRI
jgi:hypothetical protein